jgi:diguanylate cyclase (GGDEF)-like protein
MEDNMQQLAMVDPLTGAYNRRRGDELLALELKRHIRFGHPFAVLMMDIDHFKAVNDELGHQAGDEVLCALVQTLRNVVRAVDMIVRWGGEEFLVVLPETDAAAAMITGERVRAAIATMEVGHASSTNTQITVSVGVAVTVGDSLDELLHRSDVALYLAKAAGRNRVMLSPQNALA